MATTDKRPYVDGWLGNERELTVIPQPLFPFKNNPTPDTYTRQYRRMYNVYPALYVPKTMLRSTWVNLLLRSEQIDNASWTKTNLTVTADAATSPDGQTTLDKLLETVTNAEHSISQAATAAAAATEAFVFAVAGLGRDFVKVSFVDSAAASFSAFFNVTSGVVGTVGANTTALIVPLGNGQFQCVIRFTPAAGAGTFKVNVASSASSISYAGDVAKGVYLWGAQVATGSAAPYVSTTDVTRSVSAPNRDRIDPMAYLLTEDDPADQTSESEIVTRLFGRIPLTQTVPGSIWVVKPALTGDFPQIIGSSLVIQPDTTQASYQFYLRKIAVSDSGSPSGANYPTGGTYTVTIGGSTTGAIAYNAPAATLQTALNALTSVSNRGSVTVTGSYNSTGGFTITFATEAAAGSVNASAITVQAGSQPLTNIGVTASNGGLTQQVNMGAYPSDINVISGGTYTVTLFGQTTGALNWNDSLATVTTAITGLSKVGASGTTVTLPGAGAWGSSPLENFGHRAIRFYVNMTRASGLAAAATGSLTPSGAGVTLTFTNDPFNLGQFTLTFFGVAASSRVVTTSTPHQIISGDTIYIKQGSTYRILTSAQYTIGDTSSIVLSAASGASFTDTGTITELGRLASVYTAGSVLSRCKRISAFYLPGVSAGIATIDDIPQPPLQSDAATLVNAIFSGTTSINWEVGELAQWNQTPIMYRVVTTINPTGL